MARFEDEALYGGAAGGGKSDCALAEALRQVEIPLTPRRKSPTPTLAQQLQTQIDGIVPR